MAAFVLLFGVASRARAQGEADGGWRETLILQEESHEVTALYVASGSALGTAAGMGVLGFLTAFSGDTVGFGIVPLFAMPGVAAFGLAMLSIAIGYDVGLGRWGGARDRRGAGAPRLSDAAAQQSLSENITWTYGVGLSLLGLSLLSFIPIAAIDGFRTPIYLLPTVVGGIGLFTLLAAAGMDIAAGAWSGYTGSIAPLEGGAMLSFGASF